MSKVKVTQEQADFIQGFQRRYGYKPIEEGKELPLWAEHAINKISRYGFGFYMEDAEGRVVHHCKEGFESKDKLTLIEAVIHGYEVEEKLYYLKHPNTKDTYVNLKTNSNVGSRVNLMDKSEMNGYKTRFTSKEIEENDLLSPFKDWKVEVK